MTYRRPFAGGGSFSSSGSVSSDEVTTRRFLRRFGFGEGAGANRQVFHRRQCLWGANVGGHDLGLVGQMTKQPQVVGLGIQAMIRKALHGKRYMVFIARLKDNGIDKI